MKHSDVNQTYFQRYNGDYDVLVTPEVAFVLRELLRFTPKRMADLSSVKKNQMLAFEQGRRHLSVRDKRWMTTAFNVAGADIFLAQGHIQVEFRGETIFENGQLTSGFKNLLKGGSFRQARWDVGLSQRKMQRVSGIPQHIISAIENNHRAKYMFADLVNGNRFLNAMKQVNPKVSIFSTYRMF